MNDDFKIEPEDIDEDMIEDDEPYEMDRRRHPPRPPGGTYIKWQFIIPTGLLILILIVLFIRTGKNTPDEQLNSMASNIENMKKTITGLEDRINQVRQAVDELEKSHTMVSQRMDRLGNRISRVAKDIGSVSGKIRELSKAEKASGPDVKERFYEVRRGDTLYGIARKNNLSLDRLRRLNGMDKNANIIPGQKLRIQ